MSRPEEIIMELTLADECAIAKSMGISYGIYKARIYEKERKIMAPPPQPQKCVKSRRRFTDEDAFALWQEGKNDCEIGIALGVSRQIIQRWRDTMELPSTIKNDIDTSKYHLVKTPRGMFVICGEE